ncbi:NUDIX hydrolase [Streptomyces sp. ODS28]|uniref:NUDIX hydrolase n=1 Tax=Streptomyces sp. ODS28 TaxID=3136688 RepID=UPI0031E8041B
MQQQNSPLRPTVSAGAVITDEFGGVLLVKPTYKAGWNLPGGHVDEGESPREACAREIREETGLKLEAGTLLAHAFVSGPGGKGGHVFYVFAAGEVTPAQQRSIRLQESELSAHRFTAPEDITDDDFPPLVRPLWRAAAATLAGAPPAYLELRSDEPGRPRP